MDAFSSSAATGWWTTIRARTDADDDFPDRPHLLLRLLALGVGVLVFASPCFFFVPFVLKRPFEMSEKEVSCLNKKKTHILILKKRKENEDVDYDQKSLREREPR